MYTFLVVLLIIDSLILIAAVLMQAGQGGGMAAAFGGVSSSASSILGTRQAGNLLTKASWTCGGIFIGLAFILSLMSARSTAPRSILDDAFAPPPAQGAPAATPNAAVPLPAAAPPAAPPGTPDTKRP